MSDAPRHARSFDPITLADMTRLAEIGERAFADVCRLGNKSSVYNGRLMVLCLCQGAALHHKQTIENVPEPECRGVADFDVWGFFNAHPERAFPWRWRVERDFGASHFGHLAGDDRRVGRKVDVIGRSIVIAGAQSPIESVLRWLQGPGNSPFAIRERPVFVISAGPDFGRMIWPGSGLS